MLTISSDVKALFSDRNPHFTPPWLSKRLSGHLSANFSGSVIDPACGAGNLLIASALRTRAAGRSPGDIEFVGVDTSMRAVRECNRSLQVLLPGGNFRIEQGNFLKVRPACDLSPATVIMNPPFRGYGFLSETTREQISRMEIGGRSNLAYAFVHRSIVNFQPKKLISLLPSNWIHSRTRIFRAALDSLGGRWEWEDIGDDAFDGLSVHLGILIW